MGIPKFYRWVSERYPLLNQPIGGATSTAPQIDNLYLDMNGVIHNCAAANKGENGEAPNPDVLYGAVMAYMDFLVSVAKPTSFVFVAVDGVAPRAKMNQQRSRRFKAVREAQQRAEQEETLHEESGARKPGATVEFPGDDSMQQPEQWDSNCITPGTQFMDELAQHIRFYVRKKQTEDPKWQRLRVIVSGPDVPGEGEHKIMDHIRWMKNQPRYNPKQSHCLYGLDADLIMLGLVAHEPNLCLLREIVRYGGSERGQPRRDMLKNPSEDSFLLFHIGLMREYLELEFTSEMEHVSLERVIDDWVLMAMLCGNDFLPQMPTLDIAEGALDLLSKTYRKLLSTFDGYLTSEGRVNVGNLTKLMHELASHEEAILAQRARDAQTAAENRGDADTAVADKINALDEDESSEQTVPEMMGANGRAMFLLSSGGGLKAWREHYYKNKVGLSANEASPWLAREYVQGLQWVCDYYFRGVPSWRWFYPCHYAPLAQDLANIPIDTDPTVKAELGEPFKPVEQLLGVLPPASAHLVPEPLRWLMTSYESPIADLYPSNFSVDLEGKRAEWEGIVLVPFMDEKRLLDALDNHWPQKGLPSNDAKRNREGVPYELVNDPTGASGTCTLKSTLPRIFADVYNCTAREMEQRNQPPRPLPAGSQSLAASLLDGAPLGMQGLPGFPTLHSLEIHGTLQYAGVCVFNKSTQKESLVLSIHTQVQPIMLNRKKEESRQLATEATLNKATVEDEEEPQSIRALANNYIGKRVFVGWPYLREAEVAYVASLGSHIMRSEDAPEQEKSLHEYVRVELANMRNRLIKQRGVDIGFVDVALGVRLSEGSVRNQDGSVQKRFAKSITIYPLQLTLSQHLPGVASIAAGSEPKLPKHGTNLGMLPPGTQCLYVGSSYFGCMAVVENEESTEDVTVNVYPRKHATPGLGKRVLETNHERFSSSGSVARKLGIHPRSLGIIAGTCLLWTDANEQVDVGLNLRNASLNMCVPDYCRPTANDDGWQYSDSAIELFQKIQSRFTWLINAVERHPDECTGDGLPIADVVPEASPQRRSRLIQEFVLWTTQQPVGKRELVRKTSKIANASAVRALAQAAPDGQTLSPVRLERVSKELLLLPITHNSDAVGAAVAGGEFALGDRIVVAATGAIAPFGERGTVVGLHDGMACEVLFDNEFPGGTTLGGRVNSKRGALLPGQELVNLTNLPSAGPKEHKPPNPMMHLQSRSYAETVQGSSNEKEGAAMSFWELLKERKNDSEQLELTRQESQHREQHQGRSYHKETAKGSSSESAAEENKQTATSPDPTSCTGHYFGDPSTNQGVSSQSSQTADATRRPLKPATPFSTQTGEEDTTDSARLWWEHLMSMKYERQAA